MPDSEFCKRLGNRIRVPFGNSGEPPIANRDRRGNPVIPLSRVALRLRRLIQNRIDIGVPLHRFAD